MFNQYLYLHPWLERNSTTNQEFTMELGEVEKDLEYQGKSIFDFEYDLPEFMDKQALQYQFLNHYYFREIGLESVPRFLQRFQTAWLEKLNEYSIKFEAAYNNLTADNLLNSYNESVASTNDISDNENGTSDLNLTPMSSLDPNKNYKTSITKSQNVKTTNANLSSTRKGYNGDSVFKNINKLITDHTNVINQFIEEFDYLFMGVL